MKRIAIYSRKSKFTGKGDSIENQIEMCKEYINKNIKDKVEFIIYEDEGFSGGTIDRPNFKKLMNDIKMKKLDILVCYRLDRISRNVADFSSTLEVLQNNNVSFISIREQFDTTTPMGRAMIYIASVFAQLERETIAERVKDNMLELAKNGRWTGGKIPVGFKSAKSKYIDAMGLERSTSYLIAEEKEMEFVEFLYNKYLELGSLHKLEVYITKNEIKSRNGIMYEKSTLKIILQNPIYVKSNQEVINYLKTNGWIVYGDPDNTHSLLTYNKTEQSIINGKYVKKKKADNERFAAISNIEGFIEPDLWLKVQSQFDENRSLAPRLGKTNNALLTGKLKCGKCKEYMLLQHGRTSKVTGEKLYYYVCSLKKKSQKHLCDNSNAKASEIESLVLLGLKQLGKTKKTFLNRLKQANNKDLNNSNNQIEKKSLLKSISEKKIQIEVLVDKLSRNQDIEDILLAKIKTLKNECTKIEASISLLDNSELKTKFEKLNIEFIDSILDECEIIDILPRDKQKKIIDTLIDTIYWYGDSNGSGNVKIKFAGVDNEEDSEIIEIDEYNLVNDRLSFNSPSMCKVNKTTTFKKVFEPLKLLISDTYYDLPETNYSEKIYKLRIINNLSRHEFAKMCDIGYTSICLYETGTRKPNNINLAKIREVFRLNKNYFKD
jgi:DNA invertase Pin-like site-specific DNA recombinase/DNA-binding transcriptional regulator YiaG